MYRMKSIGTIKTGDRTIIVVDEDYRKALKYLDQFSHIHIFYLTGQQGDRRLSQVIGELEEVHLKEGKMVMASSLIDEDFCELVDIKPYFPCEDTVRKVTVLANASDSRSIRVETCEEELPFGINPIGKIRNVNGKCYIQLDTMIDVKSSHIKILWWFHRFDANLYREVTMCNPPYENAPKTGIFATRSPVRPNPIAMTIARVTQTDSKQKRIYLSGIESFDLTPCIGIYDYEPSTDRVEEARVPAWLEHWPKCLDDQEKKADKETMPKDSFLQQLLLQADTPERGLNHVTAKTAEQEMSGQNGIVVHGARENNLKGIDVVIPYGKITAVVGVSGSGKSSLVNDTIYAECNRRMEYLNHNHNMPKPKVDNMYGCIPTVVITQDAIRGNAFSTVGTYTDAYDYLRSIYAGVGVRHCPDCGHEIIPLSVEKIYTLLRKQEQVTVCDLSKQTLTKGSLSERIDQALALGQGAFYARIGADNDILLQTKQKCYHCDKLMFEMTPSTFSYMDADNRCPVCNGTGQVVQVDEDKLIEHPERSLLDGAVSFYGKLSSFLENPNANWMKGQVFGLADLLRVDLKKPWKELPEEFRDKLLHGCEEEVTFYYDNKKNGRRGEITRKVEGICQIIERLCEENSDTHMLDRYLTKVECRACNGERLNREGRMVTIYGTRYPEAAQMTFSEILSFCIRLQSEFGEQEYMKIRNAVTPLMEIAETAEKLGIGYLQLSQDTTALSGGEGQRLKLLGAFKNHISGILYIFDEPAKALHPKDYQKIMDMLRQLRNEGNTIIMVEHNEDMIRIADYIIEIGPGAGERGGTLVGEGTLNAMLRHQGTQICRYMGKGEESVRDQKSEHDGTDDDGQKIKNQKDECIQKQEQFVQMQNLNCHNLQNISIQFPVRALTCICGVSGSGKSSLMKGEIFNRAKKEGKFSEVVLADQLPIGKTSKSIVATYIGIMDEIRSIFAKTEAASINGWDERYFSFNGQRGQCPACGGEGRVKLKYMEDTYIQCPDCKGRRYLREILEVQYHGRNIAEVLQLSIDEAVSFLDGVKDTQRLLHSLQRVGLKYLKLGQGTATLSGGEASRLKLAKEIMTKKKGNVLYLLDEPTTGLHFSDIDHLLKLMEELIESGNTIVAIEHNRQFLAHCDWEIELGPGAGREGGTVTYFGQIKNS